MPARVTLEELMADGSRIPVAPGVGRELARLCAEPTSTVEQLAAVLRCDPSLTAKVLKMANSAYFASRREIGNLPEAIVRLGLRRVEVMALAFCIMHESRGKAKQHGFSYPYFWSHALVTGTFADELAGRRRMRLSAEAMVAGLLQDIGVLVIQTAAPQEYEGVLAYNQKTQGELYVAEMRRLGFDHMQAGEKLLRRWHLPEAVCQVVGAHHHPDNLRDAPQGVHELAQVCELGAAVGKFLTRDQGRAALLAHATEVAERNFGLTAAEFQSLLQAVRLKLDASSEMFELKLDETVMRRLDASIRDQVAESVLHLTERGTAEK
jgi:HD-like signal output (HDOD) protein